MKTFFLAIVTLFVLSANAQTTKWKLDKTHSNVDFIVTHLVVSEVRGTFKDFEATFVSDKPDFTDMKVEATIKAASVFTDNERRDNHLRSNDFFNAEKYPEIKFKSTSVKKTGDATYDITGDLTIRDVTKSVVLYTKYKGSVDSKGGTRAGFKATTTIDRFEFGTMWDAKNETGSFVVSREVNIELRLVFVKQN